MNPLYQFTVALFVKQLSALDNLLAKAQSQLADMKISEAELLEARLAEDMFPFKKQVQIACDNAKGAAARLSGNEVPSHPDTEASLAELRARIAKTLEFVQGIPEDMYEGANDRQITLPYFPNQYMMGYDYGREYAIPNFFFHVTAAYAILRKEGFAIGKADYMGELPFHPTETL